MLCTGGLVQGVSTAHAGPRPILVQGVHQPSDSHRERREQESLPWVSPGCVHRSTDPAAMTSPCTLPCAHGTSPCPVLGSTRHCGHRGGFQPGPASSHGSCQLNQFLEWLQRCRSWRLCSCVASWATPRVSLSPRCPPHPQGSTCSLVEHVA